MLQVIRGCNGGNRIVGMRNIETCETFGGSGGDGDGNGTPGTGGGSGGNNNGNEGNINLPEGGIITLPINPSSPIDPCTDLKRKE